MKKIPISLVAVLSTCMGVTSVGAGSQILSLKEIQQDGSERTLKKNDVADLNSTIRVIIERDELRKRLAQYANSAELADMIAQMDVLRKAAIEGQKSIPDLNQALAEWAQSSKDGPAIARLQERLNKSAETALTILNLAARGTALRNTLNIAFAKTKNRPAVEQLKVIYEEAEKEAARINNSIEAALKKDGIYVLMGAWINTSTGSRPIHLEGYDVYPIGERFEVPRFNFVLSDEQKKQIDKYAEISHEINERGLGDYLEENYSSIGATASTEIKAFIADLKPCLDLLNEKLLDQKKALGNTYKEVVSKSDDLITATQMYVEFLKEITLRYDEKQLQTTTAGSLLTHINTDIIQLQEKTVALAAAYNDLLREASKIPSRAKTDAIKARDAVKSVADNCINDMNAKMLVFKNVQMIIATLFSGKQFSSDITEFGNSVLKHDIANLPDDPEFSLLNTGARDAGDTVVIKIAGGSAALTKRELERQDMTLFHTITSVNTAVGLIFARHGDTFQAAPSYSWLFKFKSNSMSYKQFVDFGVGLNLSALDFNHDDAPELGVALAFSFFRDYVQFGYGCNIHANKGYAFFGLSLPLPTK
jgi:hypothetical protein